MMKFIPIYFLIAELFFNFLSLIRTRNISRCFMALFKFKKRRTSRPRCLALLHVRGCTIRESNDVCVFQR